MVGYKVCYSMNQVRAALYARVSRPDEKDILENQLLSLRDYINSRGFSPGGEYVDIASGGSSDRRDFNRLMEEASHPQKRPFDLVVFTSLSRMTRGGIAAALDTLRVLKRHEVGWAFIDQPVLNNDSATPKLARDIILAVLAAVDEDYRARISKATRAAFARRRALAEANGEKVKWGRPRKGPPPQGEVPV